MDLLPPARAARSILLFVIVLLVAGCGGDEAARPAESDASREREARTETSGSKAPAAPESIAPAQLEEIVGELIMTKLAGPVATSEELAAIARLHVGGVILFGPNVRDEAQLRALLESVQRARSARAGRAGLPAHALISVDQEGGPIRNVPFAPPEHTQPQLAGLGLAATEGEARATGRALSGLGISMDLGPVADLAAGPNRTMAGRAFGESHESVAPLVAASVRGLQAGGVAAVAKHFPGFGASSANSDEAIARVARTRAELLAEELAPFRAAIKADVMAVMVSHGVHDGLGSKVPGILEPKVVTQLLRDELGFEGVAMTDSMNARGFREQWGDTVPRACPVAIAAGIDLLLLTGTLETARLCRDRILDAVRDGSLDEARVREAVERVAVLREAVDPAAA